MHSIYTQLFHASEDKENSFLNTLLTSVLNRILQISNRY